jgi:hypothetical protein
MGYQATLSDGVYHRGGEFDGNIDFRIVIQPEVPLPAVLDNLRVIRADDPEPCEILGYAERDGGFDLTVYAEGFPFEAASSVQICWVEQDIGVLELRLEEGEDAELTPSSKSGCGATVILLAAGLFGILTRVL